MVLASLSERLQKWEGCHTAAGPKKVEIRPPSWPSCPSCQAGQVAPEADALDASPLLLSSQAPGSVEGQRYFSETERAAQPAWDPGEESGRQGCQEACLH